MEMEWHKVSVLAVTETHSPDSGEIVLDESKGCSMVFSGRQDGSTREGVGLALAPKAEAVLRCYQAVSSRILTGEFPTRRGPLLVVVVYATTDQSNAEDKDLFYSDLDSVMTNANRLVIVMEDFNAAIRDSVQGEVGPHGLSRKTNDNGERLVSFASSNDLTITNTLFPHKRIHQSSWYPPNPGAQPSLKDYALVRRRLRSSVLDTRVFRGADIDSDHRLVIASIEVKLAKKVKCRKGKFFDVPCLKQSDKRANYMEEVQKCFSSRKQESVEAVWKELKEAVVGCAEQHLQSRRQPQRQWLSTDTTELVERKRQKFAQWQEQHTSVERQRECVTLCKQVRRAIRADKERWWNEKMTELEDDMKHNRQGDIFKKLKRLSGTSGTPADTILDEARQPLKKPEEKLARWRRHFERTETDGSRFDTTGR